MGRRALAILGLSTCLCVIGCAQASPVPPPAEALTADSGLPADEVLAPGADEGLTGSEDPADFASPSPSPTPTPPPAPTPVVVGPAPSVGVGLVVGAVTVKLSGLWLWQRCTASVTIENPTASRLSGTILVTFERDGDWTDAHEAFITGLAPGKRQVVELKSDKRANQARAEVESSEVEGSD